MPNELDRQAAAEDSYVDQVLGRQRSSTIHALGIASLHESGHSPGKVMGV